MLKTRLTKTPFTKEGYKNLLSKYQKLKDSRQGAVQTLSQARELGDLSENGLYKAARAKLSSIDANLTRLDFFIKLADVKESNQNSTIDIGNYVKLDNGKQERTFQIVGKYEADPLNNKISNESPLGKTLIGKRTSDEISVATQNGIVNYKIIEISISE